MPFHVNILSHHGAPGPSKCQVAPHELHLAFWSFLLFTVTLPRDTFGWKELRLNLSSLSDAFFLDVGKVKVCHELVLT